MHNHLLGCFAIFQFVNVLVQPLQWNTIYVGCDDMPLFILLIMFKIGHIQVKTELPHTLCIFSV